MQSRKQLDTKTSAFLSMKETLCEKFVRFSEHNIQAFAAHKKLFENMQNSADHFKDQVRLRVGCVTFFDVLS